MHNFLVFNPVNRPVMPERTLQIIQRGIVLSGFTVQPEERETGIRQTAMTDVAVEVRKHRIRNRQRAFEKIDPFGRGQSLSLDGDAVHFPQDTFHCRIDEICHRLKIAFVAVRINSGPGKFAGSKQRGQTVRVFHGAVVFAALAVYADERGNCVVRCN